MHIEFKTDRLILRPLSIEDIDTVHVYASDIENTRYMIHMLHTTRDGTKQFLARVTAQWQQEMPSFYEFAICLNGTQIGAVAVYLNEQRSEGEMGWILNKHFWGNGYATEAAKAIKDFSMKEMKISKLVATCDYRNVASSNIMKKLGMRLESDTGTRQYPDTLETAKELKYSIAKSL